MKPAPATFLSLAVALLVLLVAAPLAVAADTATPTKPAASKQAKDDRSAAERRAAGSEFEREKLGSAFDKAQDEQETKKDEGSSGSGGSLMRALLGLVVVLGVIYGVHYLLKKWGQSKLQGVAGSGGVIDVIATTPLAQGRALHLVRVGGEVVLVGATEQSITRIGEVDSTALGAMAANQGNGEFQAMLNGSMFGSQPGVPQGMGGAGAANEPFLKRFLDNLRLSTAR